ncbi:MAG TPA: hypothetical protein VN778_02120, partial [Verrucomicrobiae bacterium]|nr:hypothetical protein [Verrucomicrobiae bacterium]
SSGNFQVFLQSTGSIDQYIKYTSGTWGSGAPATMSGIISQPWAFQDATGNINFFFNTSGGSDHYEYSGGSWGSEVALSNSSLIYWPFAYHITISGTDYYVVIVETASGITDWWRPTSGGTWSHETTATVTPTSGMVGYVDGSNNQNMFVNTLTTLNHYENSGAGWGGEQVYHD